MTRESIEIPRRFRGPPRSGNGGYVAGRLASFVETSADTPAVAVRLAAPPPLERRLAVREEDGRIALFDGDDPVAHARATALTLAPPPAPRFEQAERAAKSFRGFEEHVFPGCFVCGHERADGDGLRIFPGPADPDGLFAAPWIPDASLREAASELVPAPFVWAALDCPGAFCFPQPEGRVILLGELQLRSLAPVSIGERCVVTSWPIEQDGRKHRTGSALHGEDGACRAYAQGIWIEVDPEYVPRG